MECVSVSTEVICVPEYRKSVSRIGYDMDVWMFVRSRWACGGVAAAAAAAVLRPTLGASGGMLHSEYSRYLPLCYIYYSAGCHLTMNNITYSQMFRTAVWSAAHALVVSPALCVVLVAAARPAIHDDIATGLVMLSGGSCCGWLGVAVCPHAAPPAAVTYLLSLCLQPVLMALLCGRATVPPLGGIISTVLVSATPFGIGALQRYKANNDDDRVDTDGTSNVYRNNNRAPIVCALLLVYVDCCNLLRDSEGSLYVGDVLATMLLVFAWVCASAVCVWCYRVCGALRPHTAALVALVAVPKCAEPGWVSSTACTAWGLSRLACVFASPAQALLLAALLPGPQHQL